MNGLELEQAFAEASAKRSEFLRLGQIRKANKEYDRVHSIKNQMRARSDRGEGALKRLCESDDLDLRLLAAANLLAVDEAYAIKQLEAIAAPGAGMKAFEARMTLKEWRKGALREYLE
jgi:hypothetical protein